MSKKICCVCNKKLSVFSRAESLFKRKLFPGGKSVSNHFCEMCGCQFHWPCGISTLDYEYYIKGKIHYIKCCTKCSEDTLKLFEKERHCITCGKDYLTYKPHLSAKELLTFWKADSVPKTRHCEMCNKIGHIDCYNKNALIFNGESINIYPYLYDKAYHRYLCNVCIENLSEKINTVKSQIPKWVHGTRNEYIRDYKTIKTIRRIEYKGTDCSDPSEVEEVLKLRAIQVGGNAFVKYYWEKHVERHEEEYLAGYSENNNPYYRTRYSTEKHFTGYATAVVVESSKDHKGRKL